MQKSPELIIEEFESRQEIEVALRRRKLRHRIFEATQPYVLGIAFVILSFYLLPDRKLVLLPFAALAVGYLEGERRRRWALEDRLEALEKKAMTDALK
ncbi:MAG: hypothetical protein JSS11_16145 [Verrucomicrobia bacterium]|nr:hypothetical protein [Verrucomicrobiota bacterium]